MHILRASYVSNIWRNAHIAKTTLKDPELFGYEKKVQEKEYYDFKWFHGQLMPKIKDFIIEEVEEDLQDDSGMNILFLLLFQKKIVFNIKKN